MAKSMMLSGATHPQLQLSTSAPRPTAVRIASATEDPVPAVLSKAFIGIRRQLHVIPAIPRASLALAPIRPAQAVPWAALGSPGVGEESLEPVRALYPVTKRPTNSGWATSIPPSTTATVIAEEPVAISQPNGTLISAPGMPP